MTGTQLELFSIEDLNAAPVCIGRDEYAGPHTVRFNARKFRVAVYTAAELATLMGRETVLFESFGHVGGVEHFTRTRFVSDAAGNLHGYDSEGARKIIHPADRKLRVLTGK